MQSRLVYNHKDPESVSQPKLQTQTTSDKVQEADSRDNQSADRRRYEAGVDGRENQTQMTTSS